MPAPKRNNKHGDIVAALNAAAPEKAPVHMVPLGWYYRTASLLQRQADEYRNNHNIEQLYVMLMRYANLVLKTIPQHTAYNANDATAIRLRNNTTSAISELESLQTQLRLRDSFAGLEKRPFESKAAPPGAVKLSAGHVPGLHWAGAEEAAATSAAVIDADLAAALEGLGRPGWTSDTRTSNNNLPATTATLPAAAAAASAIAMPDLTPSVALPPASQAALERHAIMPLGSTIGYGSSTGTTATGSFVGQAAAAGGVLMTTAAAARPAAPPPPPPPEATYSSLIATLQADGGASSQIHVNLPPNVPSPYATSLQLGPQELGVHSMPFPTGPPPPGATCCTPPTTGTLADASSTSTLLTAPSSNNTSSMSEVKRRRSLRDVHVSKALMDEFLRYAASNTRRSVETCGILAGTLSPDDSRFTVTALIVPKQEGTSDTVQALAEEEIFEAQDSRSLYPLGWIHTHPSQSCFLSSVDVHTHCGYQTMLEEAVAIVMAPRDARTPVGIFRLSTPGGLNLVQRCGLRGFHAHPPTSTGQELYELCGHVYLNPRVDFEVIDLRGK